MFNKNNRIDLEVKKSYKTNIIDLSKCGFTSFPEIISDLSHIKVLNINNNKIKSIDLSKLPPFLEEINLNNNNITELNLNSSPKSLKIFSISNNKIKNIKMENSNIQCLFISNNKLVTVGKFNNNLHTAHFNNNDIIDFEDINNIKKLDCSNNKIKKFKCCEYIKCLNISNNPITILYNIPKNMNIINVRNTNINNSDNIDKNILFSKYNTGLSKSILNNLKNEYAIKIQSNTKKMLIQKKLPYIKIVRDIKELSNMSSSINPKILKVYFKNPTCKVAMRFLEK